MIRATCDPLLCPSLYTSTYFSPTSDADADADAEEEESAATSASPDGDAEDMAKMSVPPLLSSSLPLIF